MLEFLAFHIENLTFLKLGELWVSENKWDCSCDVGELGGILDFRGRVAFLLLGLDFLFFSVFFTFHFNIIISRSRILCSIAENISTKIYIIPLTFKYINILNSRDAEHYQKCYGLLYFPP